jgi:AcrR family transcriptional regulator
VPAVERKYRGASAIERRELRRAALLDAAFDVLAAEGWERVTVRAVCGRAKLNDRYFYENFRDRDELVLAVLDDVVTQGLQVAATALDSAPKDIRARSRAIVEAGLGFLVDDPRRGRLLVESQATEGLRQRRQYLVRLLATLAADQGRQLLGEHTPSDRDLELSTLVLVSGGLELATMWLRGDLDVSREHLADFVVALLLTNADIATALERETRQS